MCFLVKIVKFLTAFFIEHLWWLLLMVLSRYSKVSLSVCSLISRLHVLPILIKNYTKLCTNHPLLSRDKAISSLVLNWLITWSRAFDSRIYFGKTLISFDFDENIHKTLHTLLCNITCQKTCLAFNFRIWIGKRKMVCKQKY